ncbi:hypothetical protein K439DRAFT_828234 [Ramaria rubella]|nr:hypothetical protein K439DRAFT_828234 [Ramaria rubella]
MRFSSAGVVLFAVTQVVLSAPVSRRVHDLQGRADDPELNKPLPNASAGASRSKRLPRPPLIVTNYVPNPESPRTGDSQLTPFHPLSPVKHPNLQVEDQIGRRRPVLPLTTNNLQKLQFTHGSGPPESPPTPPPQSPSVAPSIKGQPLTKKALRKLDQTHRENPSLPSISSQVLSSESGHPTPNSPISEQPATQGQPLTQQALRQLDKANRHKLLKKRDRKSSARAVTVEMEARAVFGEAEVYERQIGDDGQSSFTRDFRALFDREPMPISVRRTEPGFNQEDNMKQLD